MPSYQRIADILLVLEDTGFEDVLVLFDTSGYNNFIQGEAALSPLEAPCAKAKLKVPEISICKIGWVHIIPDSVFPKEKYAIIFGVVYRCLELVNWLKNQGF